MSWILFEVRIGNDAPTFNTAHFTGVVFFFRDTVGEQTAMCTGAGWFIGRDCVARAVSSGLMRHL